MGMGRPGPHTFRCLTSFHGRFQPGRKSLIFDKVLKKDCSS
jgi:hypothetical protein